MYAGSTLITLTLIWGFQIILKRDMLRGKGSLPEHYEHQQDQHLSSTKSCLSLVKHKLSLLDDMGVNIQKETTTVVVIMLLSLIPFATVELVTLVCSPIMILFALVVSGASLISYFAYQVPICFLYTFGGFLIVKNTRNIEMLKKKIKAEEAYGEVSSV
ncbi:hypothetical protein Hanom_Chr11g01050901 [Helianthus anomalus]